LQRHVSSGIRTSIVFRSPSASAIATRCDATSENPKLFFGTDSAPNAVGGKESACGRACIFNAPVALETYAAVFEEEGALDRLEGFAAEHGPRFYGLPVNAGRVAIERTAWRVSHAIAAADTRIVPFQAGAELARRYKGSLDEAGGAAHE
jgi:dihydroorotase